MTDVDDEARPDFLSRFPYPTIRDQQEQVLNELARNWNQYRVFVLDCPTGTGKSGIAVAVGNETKSYLLTESKSLQDQYLREFPNSVASLKGKGNYPCMVNRNFNVETAPCQINKRFVTKCLEDNPCYYYEARKIAMMSKVFLTNYSYFFTASKGNDRMKRPTIICDEGHVLSEKLADFAKIVISVPYLRREYEIDALGDLTFSAKDTDVEILNKVSVIYNELCKVRTNLAKNLADFFRGNLDIRDDMSDIEIMASIEYMINSSSTRLEDVGQQAQDIMKTIKSINNQTLKLDFYILHYTDTWIYDVDPKDDRKITITPIDARRVFKTNVLENCDRVVLMSASMGSVKSLAEELGITEKEICYIQCDSPFDPSKAPIHIMGGFDFSYKNLESSLPGMVKYVDEILDGYPDDKGIIHAGNYKITEYIMTHSRNRNRLLGKANGDMVSNEQLYERHEETQRPTVLVSPSMHTGVDLKGDLSKFQIIVKFPFTSLQDKRTKMKMEQNGLWYSNETWKKIIQASGRSNRTEDDVADTYILDRAFNYQFKLFKMHLPDWFKKRILFHE